MILKKFLISILLVLLTFSVHADEIKNNNLNTKNCETSSPFWSYIPYFLLKMI